MSFSGGVTLDRGLFIRIEFEEKTFKLSLKCAAQPKQKLKSVF